MCDIDKAKKIIERSGNSFHCKVIDYFKINGWHFLISPYYTDNVSNKPREIDLIVEKAFQYSDTWENVHGSINVKLFIECKYIPQVNVLWFDNKDLVRTSKVVSNIMGRFGKDIYKNNHRYLVNRDRVAKLFAGENNREVENEVIYKALNQCLNAMVYHRHTGSIIPDRIDLRRNPDVIGTIHYPVIVCNSFNKFFRTDIGTNDDPVPINNNFQLEVNYAYMDFNRKQRNEFFLIDLLDFTQLDDFLEIIEDDVVLIRNVIGN